MSKIYSKPSMDFSCFKNRTKTNVGLVTTSGVGLGTDPSSMSSASFNVKSLISD